MVIVFCEEENRGVSFEYCMSCSKCLPRQMIKSLRIFDFKSKRNVYSVSEVIGCLRKAYYDRKKPSKGQALTLKSLHCIKRGKLFHRFVDSTGWQELEGVQTYKIDGEPVELRARLDCYDPDKQIIIELKSTKIFENSELPREKDVLQVQSYGSIFKDVFLEIRGLKIVYMDMSNFKQFNVEQVDRAKWLEERISVLHRAIRASKPPKGEPTYECKYCSMQKECKQSQPIVWVTPRRRRRYA